MRSLEALLVDLIDTENGLYDLSRNFEIRLIFLLGYGNMTLGHCIYWQIRCQNDLCNVIF
jgi:hypothetical protein